MNCLEVFPVPRSLFTIELLLSLKKSCGYFWCWCASVFTICSQLGQSASILLYSDVVVALLSIYKLVLSCNLAKSSAT